jgi:hypothetical protein
MSFDFDAAVQAPFRMQPGLRRLATGAAQLTPLVPGSRHQREKLAVLSAFWPQALLSREGFDATPALHALAAHAAAEQPAAWSWDGTRATAHHLATAVDAAGADAGQDSGRIHQSAAGRFGLGDEIARCLALLPPGWRLAGLLSLAFEEDLAIVDARDGTVPWMAVALPSHWAPEEKVGRHFTAIHEPVADNALLLRAADALVRMVAGPERWERFVWNVTDQPRLHAHPSRVDPSRWAHTAVERAWFRSERQTFIPLPALGESGQAVFTIQVAVQPLAAVLDTPERAARLHAAVATMSPAVLAYRGLVPVRDALLAWLDARTRAPT